MTKITKNTFFTAGEDWSEQEVQTAAEEYSNIKDTLERVAQGKRDTVVLAGAAIRIFEKHGQKSPLYRDFLNSLAQNAPGWNDADFRRKAYDAYRGYEALSGTDSDKEFIWKLKPSLSALTECQRIHPSQQYKFREQLKDSTKFPTRDAVSSFAGGKKLSGTSKVTTYTSAPIPTATPYVAPEVPFATPEPCLADVVQEPINVTPSIVEVVNPQQVLIEQLIECCQKLNLDELYSNEEQLELLKPYRFQMESLYEMVNQNKSIRPNYV